MLSKEEINKIYEILSCDNCSTSYACEACDITWTDKNLIKKYIDQLEKSDTSKEKSSMNYYNKCKDLEQENNKLNKMIDEMAKWIYIKDYNSQEIMLICERNEDYYSNNIEKVKQHFEKKVEEKN